MEYNNYPNVGDLYGDMKIVEYIGIDNNYMKLYKVMCIKCNGVKTIQLSRLRKLDSCFHINENKQSCKYVESLDVYIGMTVNDYTIIKFIKHSKQGNRYLAKCNVCGIEFETYVHNFIREYGTKHENCTDHLPQNNKHLKRFRKIYSCMRYRTTNENYNEYYLYGGRGISSEYYSDFIRFYKDLFNSYMNHVLEFGSKNTTLDRINPDGNYELSNCRWATQKEQANNKRQSFKVRIVDINGNTAEYLNLEEASIILNLNKNSMYNALREGRKYKGMTIQYVESLPYFKQLTGLAKGE